MIRDKTVLAIIPARGGSKSVKRKNIRHLGKKPLIAWTIEAAKESFYIDKLILSSEDEEIIRVAKDWGCEVPFQRPMELAEDDTPGIAPVIHAIEVLPGYDYVVLLQPTSPLRQVVDIDGCIEKCVFSSAEACVSVTEVGESPYWMYTITKNGLIDQLIKTDKSFVRRQDLPQVYKLNGAVYVAQCDWLRRNKTFVSGETIAYIMPFHRSLDIDSELDMEMAELIIKK
ncbi:acylneuraminate cytidylyltransferase family protein [Cylindrospermopsis raciborskii]|uniref:acylneuraminate cytidylyltransferase family protein n=1 Tax=Cylindrospermopsis raciborskii TaxID=77022 RepID=UPI0022BBAAF3|nr:acylneuraminate cytidylyltransferase family protein [Cylindrospermopsis raciborskii]MCZ2207371.1 acylneuraminate cytidylyltransferase family protein [Cylindrospermopsis raciborskii PAMP2011]